MCCVCLGYKFTGAFSLHGPVFSGQAVYTAPPLPTLPPLPPLLQGLHAYFSEVCDEAETAMFFGSVLPRVVELALSLPRLVTHAVPLLQRQQPYRLSLSQQQTACLLANALFYTFPRR